MAEANAFHHEGMVALGKAQTQKAEGTTQEVNEVPSELDSVLNPAQAARRVRKEMWEFSPKKPMMWVPSPMV